MPLSRRPSVREDLVLVADLAVGDQNEDAIPNSSDEPLARSLTARSSGRPSRCRRGLRPPARYSTARNRLRSVAGAQSRPGSPGGVSIALSKARTQNRSAVAERVDHPRHGAAGRHDLPAFHASRSVEHEGHGPRPRPAAAG